MKKLVMAALVALAFSGSAFAADGKAPNPQHDRMKACNAEAGEKKGDDRKAFMKSCLSEKKKADDDKKKTQQEKMKSCNKEAGDKKMKGDDRKKFMSDCLKG